ncbi:MAG: Sir2 family NAD-dependent protein deacetylase [Sedimentisphaerales bacterium]|nr:Sir2 family NAD-dependent protein deacetylase [Sedimentisphaerales bacterium]
MNSNDYARHFLETVSTSDYSVVLTGAGVSTDSGIPDFRSPDGLYSKISQETFELDYFLNQPQDYYKTAIDHIHPLADKEPNITHKMLALLQKHDLLHAIITQNIDGLHQKAGATNIIEFHGNVTGFHCIQCGKTFDRTYVDKQIRTCQVPYCPCHSLIRPDIVFFGDMIPLEALNAAQLSAGSAKVFIVMGTSLQVHPASSMATLAKRYGAKLYIINREPTAMDTLADWVCHTELTDFSQAVMNALAAKERPQN